MRVQGSGWAAGHGQRGAGVGTSRSVMSMARTAPAAQEGSIRQQQDGGTALRLPLLLPSADKANYRAARRVELTSGCTAAVHQGLASPPSTAPRRSACDGLTWCGVAAPCPSLSPRAHRARPLLAALLRCGTLGCSAAPEPPGAVLPAGPCGGPGAFLPAVTPGPHGPWDPDLQMPQGDEVTWGSSAMAMGTLHHHQDDVLLIFLLVLILVLLFLHHFVP